MASIDIKLMTISVSHIKGFSVKKIKKKPLTYLTAIISMLSITMCSEV